MIFVDKKKGFEGEKEKVGQDSNINHKKKEKRGTVIYGDSSCRFSDDD